jgi:hypothetical protein
MTVTTRILLVVVVPGRDRRAGRPPDLTVPADAHNRALACATDVAATASCIKFAAPARPAVPLTDPGRCRTDP